jgi:hypothetical protein
MTNNSGKATKLIVVALTTAFAMSIAGGAMAETPREKERHHEVKKEKKKERHIEKKKHRKHEAAKRHEEH